MDPGAVVLFCVVLLVLFTVPCYLLPCPALPLGGSFRGLHPITNIIVRTQARFVLPESSVVVWPLPVVASLVRRSYAVVSFSAT